MIRCTDCSQEFTTEDVGESKTCPSCKTTATPMDTEQDILLKINWHELRILTIWADNYAQEHCNDSGKLSLSKIIERLSMQRPDGNYGALTIANELQEMATSLGRPLVLMKDGKTAEFKPESIN